MSNDQQSYPDPPRPVRGAGGRQVRRLVAGMTGVAAVATVGVLAATPHLAVLFRRNVDPAAVYGGPPANIGQPG
ncbi:hypothetical protein ACFQ0D_29100, partial [Micromonospora zhanjiangensis]